LYAFIALILFIIILTSRIAAVYNLSKTATASVGVSKTYASAYYLANSSAASASSKASPAAIAAASSSAFILAASSAANIAATS
jgi:hypothetical protein